MPLPLIPPVDGYNHLTKLDGTADVKFRWAPTITQELDAGTVLMRFDGRQWPLAFFKEFSDEGWDVEFMIDTLNDGDQWANLRALVDGAQKGLVTVWTDVFGNQFNCVVTTKPVTRNLLLGAPSTTSSGRPLGVARFQRVKLHIDRVE